MKDGKNNNKWIRKRVLPKGWYPDSLDSLETIVTEWQNNDCFDYQKENYEGISAIVPHAGWFFSGEIAFKTIQCLKKNAERIIVVGGHLPAGSGVLAAFEDYFESTTGAVSKNDKSFIENLNNYIEIQEDTIPDNTVEVILPLVYKLHPNSKIVWLRCGAGEEAIQLAEALSKIILDDKTIVIGSTDLTHYGPNYNFTIHLNRKEALDWVTLENDASIIDAMIKQDWSGVIKAGNEKKAACSAGAAVTAMIYAKTKGYKNSKLIKYDTSYTKNPDNSFVGYAGILYY